MGTDHPLDTLLINAGHSLDENIRIKKTFKLEKMMFSKLIPQVQNSFRTDGGFPAIRAGFEEAKKQIGNGRIRGSEFEMTRIKNRRAAYRIIGRLEKNGTGYRISYHIRLHRVLQWVYWSALPFSVAMFFLSEPFSGILQIEAAILPARLAAHLLIVVGGIWVMYKLLMADMDRSDAVLKDNLNRKEEPVILG